MATTLHTIPNVFVFTSPVPDQLPLATPAPPPAQEIPPPPAISPSDAAGSLKRQSQRFGDRPPSFSPPEIGVERLETDPIIGYSPVIRDLMKRKAEVLKNALDDESANDEAFEILNQAVELNPHYLGTRLNLALIAAARFSKNWRNRPEHVQAVSHGLALVERALRDQPHNLNLWKIVFQIHFWTRRTETAAAVLKEILNRWPDFDVASVTLFEQTAHRVLKSISLFDVGYASFKEEVWKDGSGEPASEENLKRTIEVFSLAQRTLENKSRRSLEEEERLNQIHYLIGWCFLRLGHAEETEEKIRILSERDVRLSALLEEAFLAKVYPPKNDPDKIVPVLTCSASERARLFKNTKPAKREQVLASFIAEVLEATEHAGESDHRLAKIFAKDQNLNLLAFMVSEPDAFQELLKSSPLAPLAGQFDPRNFLSLLDGSLKAQTGMDFSQALELLCLTKTSAEREALLSPALTDQNVALFLTTFETKLDSLRLADFGSLDLLIDPKTGISGDQDVEKLIRETLPLYYEKLPLKEKKRILKRLLELPPNAAPEERVFRLIEASGPAMQKLFQLYGPRLKSEKLQKALEELRDGIRPFSLAEARAILAEDLGIDPGNAFLGISESPVASASVSQTYFALLATDEGLKKVAIKIRRPSYLEQISLDFDILESVVADDFAREVIAKLKATLFREADFRNEARNVRLGEGYSRALSVKLVKELPSSERVLFMDWVEAPTLRRWRNLTRQETFKAYYELASVFSEWVERALASDGFFHGDPHGGNLTFDKRAVRVGYLDYGNAGILSADQQSAFATLAAAAFLKNATLTTNILASFAVDSPLSAEKKEELFTQVKNEFATTATPLSRMNSVFARAVKLGVPLPETVIEFQRGLLLFETELLVLRQALEKKPLSFQERGWLAWHSIESAAGRAILKKLGGKIPQGLQDLSLILGRSYLRTVGKGPD